MLKKTLILATLGLMAASCSSNKAGSSEQGLQCFVESEHPSYKIDEQIHLKVRLKNASKVVIDLPKTDWEDCWIFATDGNDGSGQSLLSEVPIRVDGKIVDQLKPGQEILIPCKSASFSSSKPTHMTLVAGMEIPKEHAPADYKGWTGAIYSSPLDIEVKP